MLRVLERINRVDAPAEPATRHPQDGRDDLRQRLERLGDGHPSSDRYSEPDLSRRDGRVDASRADTNREDATGTDTDREDATGTRRDDHLHGAARAGSEWEGRHAGDDPHRAAERDVRVTTDRDRHILDG